MMLKKSSIYITLWLLIQLLIEVNCQKTPFEPLKRFGHTTTLINNKLYILGGEENQTQFFYLDVSVPFNTKTLLWNDLTSINTIPTHRGATSVKGGANNDTLILFGGLPQNDETMELLYTFDTQINSWNIPETTGDSVKRKFGSTGIVDYNGKMYIFDGHSTRNALIEMLILDTINLNWGRGSIVNAPSPRRLYGATL